MKSHVVGIGILIENATFLADTEARAISTPPRQEPQVLSSLHDVVPVLPEQSLQRAAHLRGITQPEMGARLAGGAQGGEEKRNCKDSKTGSDHWVTTK